MSDELLMERLKKTIQEMKDISRLEYMVFDAEGRFLAGTGSEVSQKVQEALDGFLESPAQQQFAFGFYFVKILSGEELVWILVADAKSQDEQMNMLVGMAASQLRSIYLIAHAPMDRHQYLRQLFLGNLKEEEQEFQARRLQLEENPRNLFVLEFEEEKNEIAMETLKNLFLQDADEYLVDMNAYRAVLVKSQSGMEGFSSKQLATMIIDNIQSEAMQNLRVSYGNHITSLSELEQKYQEACTALKISRIFHPKGQVVRYDHLGLGRLIYQLPLDLCEMFLKEVFGKNKLVEFDEEMLVTIDKLFENNLNISETARQLYVHRNTLVYRLERLQKMIGLDIRTFEDAMMFRIAMMVQAHIFNLKKNR